MKSPPEKPPGHIFKADLAQHVGINASTVSWRRAMIRITEAVRKKVLQAAQPTRCR